MNFSKLPPKKGSAIRAFLILNALFFGPGLAAQAGMTILCRNDKMVRSLRVDKADDGTCKAVYTKVGVDQVVGSSMHEEGCTTVIEGIRKTLESNVWKCKDVKDSGVSYLSED